MALAHLVLSLSPSRPGLGNDVVERRKGLALALYGEVLTGREVTGRIFESPGAGAADRRRQVESGQKLGSVVEIPVTCYQILGVPEKAEKDEVVKAAMVLKNSEIEDGYTPDAIVSRQELLVDVRDKILFEPEYAGNLKDKIPPRSSLRIPWSWLPGALCLLQEVGQEKSVLEIGRAALHLPDAKPYVHDLLLSMALAECSVAKIRLEKNKVSDGFEALARAQYLLRSKISLGKMPLLSQIEESLEELAPACTLELLGVPHTPDNAERRRGAISALRELLRQGLDVESSCRVQDWPCFLDQALRKLMATEIVDLISWDAVAIARKNKKSLESQNQRVVIDFDCFYIAMIAHIALGFSLRQTDLVNKAKTICECLTASEGVDLKFEEAFCSLLLGQGSETVAAEMLRQLEVNGSSAVRKFESNIPNKEANDKGTGNQLLEMWLKDAVLCIFPDTRDCSPSLATFFGGPKRTFRGNKQNLGSSKAVHSFSQRPLSVGLSSELGASDDQHHINATLLGEAVKRLAPGNLQSQQSSTKNSGSGPSVHLKRDLRIHESKIWDNWSVTGDLAGKVPYILLVGCFIFGTFKLFSMQIMNSRDSHKWVPNHSKMSSSAAWTDSPGLQSLSFADRRILGPLGKLLAVFRHNRNHKIGATTVKDTWPTDDLSCSTTALVTGSTLLYKRQMPLEEAEALVKQWQEIKAEALGPSHQIQTLPEILDGSMLSKWQDLANSAKARSCFWRFVLLQLSVMRADIGWDEDGNELAEIEALLEEAAELIDDSQPRKPSYYSKYKVQYVLRRHDDGSWRFCRGGIQYPV
ncbi:plastid division protein CDP1, chloroplastic [Asparagus officinalis]|uniref:plastid division protein CDP1, chloroplastic n=1 Tax=Asparagus officinalis TaxID=4686 RepID=UPI00098E0261|nr:plastid division protein CDP1, chloroplastic [Asparagus officinalis]